MCPTNSIIYIKHNFSFYVTLCSFSKLVTLYSRYKILNPERLRGEYGKLMYVLQDSQIPEVIDDDWLLFVVVFDRVSLSANFDRLFNDELDVVCAIVSGYGAVAVFSQVTHSDGNVCFATYVFLLKARVTAIGYND